MAIEIVTIGGIDVIAQMFNAVAAMTNNSSFFSLMGIAEIIGVAACVFSYIKTRDLQRMGVWIFFFVIINGLLLTPKVDLVITDRTTVKVKPVNNVPIGVALPFYLFSLGGNSLAEMYDKLLAQPNDVQYTRTGMLFGQRLVDRAFNSYSDNTAFESNMARFTESCVIPDIEINHKYDYQDFYNSKDLFEFFLSNPKFKHSENRHLYYKNGMVSEFVTCLIGAKRLKADLEKIVQQKLNRNKPLSEAYLHNPVGVPGVVLQNAYGYLMQTSKNAADIYKQNIMVNSLKRKLEKLPASFDGTADMVAITSEQSLMKMRLSQQSSYQLATRTIPSLYTVFSALMIGIFPIIILAMFVAELSGSIVKSYMGFLFSLMLYPVLFAILNSIMNTLTYQQLGGEAFTISNSDNLKATLSDIGGTAGYLTLSIPFISFGLIKGLGQAISSAGSYLGNALASMTSTDAAQVAAGNYNFGNLQMENVNGFKTDLNSVWRMGQHTIQNVNGTETTIAADGSYIHNARAGMSSLATNINWNQVKQATFGSEDRTTHEQRQSFERASVQSVSTAKSYLDEVLSGHNHNHTIGNNKTGGQSSHYNEGFGNTATAGENTNVSKDKSTSSSIADTETAQGRYNISAGGSLGFGSGKRTGGSIGMGADGAYITGSDERTSVSDAQAMKIAQEASDIMRKTGDVGKAYQYLNQNINNVQDSAYYNQLNRAATEFRNANEYRETASNLEAKSRAYSVYANESDAQSAAINRQLDQRFAEHLAAKYGIERANTILDPNPSRENEILLEQEAKMVVGQYYSELANMRAIGTNQIDASFGTTPVNSSTVVAVDSAPVLSSVPNGGQFKHYTVSPNTQNQDQRVGSPQEVENVIKGKEKQFEGDFNHRQNAVRDEQERINVKHQTAKEELGDGVKTMKKVVNTAGEAIDSVVETVKSPFKSLGEGAENVYDSTNKVNNGW